ncbi:hypothetical protein COY07_02085, partial [Candidatus Peregrinibacteria bacterium CG_4_10_14_0_2_um_filter_43_11]
SFNVTEQDRQFYAQIQVPEPQFCPDCRRHRRLAFWPFGVLQKRKCDFSGESIISSFSPDCRFSIYKRDYWFSDKWVAPEQEVDLHRSFFDQLYELQVKTPHFHQLGKNNINSDYADDIWDSKNIYLSRSMATCEDLCYCYRVLYCKDSIDLSYCYTMEQSYECTYCFKCFNVKFSLDSHDCSDSYFLYDCRGCRNCFMCWNLRNKEYAIFNKSYSKNDYEEKIKSLQLGSRKFLEELKRRFQEHVKSDSYHKNDHNVNIQNCTGNYIVNCKNCREAYFMEDAEDAAFVLRSPQIKTCYDGVGLFRSELCYEICQSTDLHNVQFACYCVDCHDCQYIDQCFNCQNCFGCVGLRRKRYCILNKQYTKEEYERMVERIVERMVEAGEYGEFFPYRMAYNGFNLSLAAFYYHETEESIQAKGGYFEAEPESHAQGVEANQLPDRSEDILDNFIGKPILCSKTGKPYNFIKKELDFYRHHHLPLPIFYPEERNRVRYKQLSPFGGRTTDCFQCHKTITVYYPEDYGYKKVLCEECYLNEVY